MNVTRLHLANCKRFTELTIDLTSCAGAPKLVLLIGANGSGKSSVFDAFEYLSAQHKGDTAPPAGRFGDGFSDGFYKGEEHARFTGYRKKDLSAGMSVSCSFGGGFEVRRSDASPAVTSPLNWDVKSAFYGRSSLRTIPELRRGRGAAEPVGADRDRPRRYIDPDTRFETDVSEMAKRIQDEVWESEFDSDQLRARFVDPVNAALTRIFDDGSPARLHLTRISPALEDRPPDIRFRKGTSEIHYDLLSSGEKEVLNVLLNLFARREHFPNAVYFIDELDVHLHTRLQHALLREVVEHWIPDCSQLWTASHSLGFIEYASEAADAVIVDFDDLDFDRPQVLTPSPKSADVFDIAVPRDAALKVFPNKTLVLCENRDVVLYNAIDLPDFLFVAARDKNAVGLQVRANEELRGLIDRDYIGAEEIEALRREQPRLFVLGYYSIESYLLHPQNLTEMAPDGFDGTEYRRLLRERMAAIRDRLLMTLQQSRSSYEILKALPKETKDRAMQEIAEATASEGFETFYPFLDMKNQRPGDYLAPLNLQRLELARTDWMRRAIAEVLTIE
ncbi:MAG: AAA family ATPase [Acidobacteria bacterium]|nr:AAA family ATPase [Acidobacteriota bacterium]